MDYSIKSIKLLRNSSTVADLAEAKTKIETYVKTTKASENLDGVAILGRYTSENVVKTVMGLVNGSGLTASITYVDATSIESAITSAQSDIKNIQEEIKEITGSTESGGTIDLKIKAAIEKLHKEDTAEKNQYVSSVNETDGVITVSRTQIPVTGVSDEAVASQFVTAVKVENNTVKATRAQANASDIIVSGTTLLSDKITAMDKATKVVIETSSTTSGMLKTYTVKQGDETVGTIDIPKDFLVKSGSIVTGTWSGNTFTPSTTGKDKALALVINSKDATATDETVYINVKDLCDVYTAGDGIQVSNNQFSIKVASGNETFLSVDGNGVKLSGVQTAIDTAKNAVIGSADDASGSTTVYGAKKYAETIVAASTAKQISVAAGNGVSIATEGTKNTISAKVKDSNEAIKVGTSGLYLDFTATTVDCGTF